MTEAELQAAIVELAESLGLVVLHIRDVRREHQAWTGFPDLFIVGSAGVAYRELKPVGGQLRGEQKRWQWRLRQAGQDSRVWRPADWHAGTIAAELAALAGNTDVVVSNDPDPEAAFWKKLYERRR